MSGNDENELEPVDGSELEEMHRHHPRRRKRKLSARAALSISRVLRDPRSSQAALAAARRAFGLSRKGGSPS